MREEEPLINLDLPIYNLSSEHIIVFDLELIGTLVKK